MSNVIKGRVQSKRDTTANWNAAKNFIPLLGEIIIYSDYYGENTPAIKVGDGKTKVQDLGFLGFEAHFDNLPIRFVTELSDGEKNVVYVNTTDGSIYYYDGEEFIEIESTSIADIENSIDEINDRISTNETIIQTNSENISSLQTQINQIESDKRFVHKQAVASDTWIITHNLGKYPSITVVDSAGTVVIGDIILQTTEQATIKFSSAFGGKAYCN